MLSSEDSLVIVNTEACRGVWGSRGEKEGKEERKRGNKGRREEQKEMQVVRGQAEDTKGSADVELYEKME